MCVGIMQAYKRFIGLCLVIRNQEERNEEKGTKYMAIGARDFIDKLLVEKYAKEQVDNHDNTESRIKPDEVFEVMNHASCNAINYFKLSQRLAIACYAVNAKAAQYRTIKPIQQRAAQ